MPRGMLKVDPLLIARLLNNSIDGNFKILDVRGTTSPHSWSHIIELLVEHPYAPIVEEGELLPLGYFHLYTDSNDRTRITHVEWVK